MQQGCTGPDSGDAIRSKRQVTHVRLDPRPGDLLMRRDQHTPASVDRNHTQAERTQFRGVQTRTSAQIKNEPVRRKQLREPTHPRTQHGAISTALQVLAGDSVVALLGFSGSVHERTTLSSVGASTTCPTPRAETRPSLRRCERAGRPPRGPGDSRSYPRSRRTD